MDNLALTHYMNRAIKQLVQAVFRQTLANPRETVFLIKFRRSSRLAAQRRLELENKGHHIPAFLIASITQSCNLFCSGCYARAGGICQENGKEKELTAAEWGDLFDQAEKAGIQFILLAGGEPLIRQEVLIEYVPVDERSRLQAIADPERKMLADRQVALKELYPSVLFLSFPGDEAEMGGCLAAGRGFFHISPSGEAEACPFAPFSDRSLRRQSLLAVLQSDFFRGLQQENLVGGEHSGGCTLFEHKEAVAALLQAITTGKDN